MTFEPAIQFGLNAKIFFAQLVNFLIVLLVLWRFAYKPVVAMIEAREEKIKKSVTDAEAIERRMKETERERADVLKAARVEAQKVVEKAEADANVRRDELAQKTKHEVEKIVAQGKAQIASERERMFAELRADVAGLAIAAAEKVLGKEIEKKTSQKLAEETVEKGLV